MSAEDGRAPSAIKKTLDPLIAWYKEFKPDVKRVVVSQDDFDRLMAATPRTLRNNDFDRVANTLVYKGFDLVRK